jgi:PE family
LTSLSIAPEIVTEASRDLESLGSELRRANAAAATQTTSFAAPAADEVSTAFTELLSTHAQGFRALSAQAAAFHDEFVNLLSGASGSYASTEAASADSIAGISLPVLKLEENLTATGTVKTPFGVLNLLTANGTASIFPNGDLQASLTAHLLSAPPLSLSVNGTPVVSVTGFEELLTATGSVNTPFGALNLLTANGSATILLDGDLQASLSARVLFFPPLSLSVNGTPVSPLTLLAANESA